jgi:hypothetical protein
MIPKNAGKLVNFLLRVGSLLWGLEPPPVLHGSSDAKEGSHSFITEGQTAVVTAQLSQKLRLLYFTYLKVSNTTQ